MRVPLATAVSFMTIFQSCLVSSTFTNRNGLPPAGCRCVSQLKNLDSTRKRDGFNHRTYYMSNCDPFVSGSELVNLRTKISSLKEQLRRCLESDDIHRAIVLRESLRQQEKKDPELGYIRALWQIKNAQRSNRISKYELIAKYTENALTARQYITRFNLDGLWIGTFSDHGKGLINVTYSGDTLIATKVTGDRHVPRGEISFRVDLKPMIDIINNHSSYDTSMYDSLQLQTSSSSSIASSSILRPIELTHSIGSRWSTSKLERYSGWGQIASLGYKNATFVPGQMILFPSANNTPRRGVGGKNPYPVEPSHFSFLWLPTKHHIVFSRPTLDEISMMTRDILSIEDEKSNIQEYIQQCFQLDWSAATTTTQNEKKGESMDDNREEYENNVILLKNNNPFRRIPMVSDLELLSTEENELEAENIDKTTSSGYKKLKASPSFSVISFWAAKQFRNFFDGVSSSLKDRSSKTTENNNDSP